MRKALTFTKQWTLNNLVQKIKGREKKVYFWAEIVAGYPSQRQLHFTKSQTSQEGLQRKKYWQALVWSIVFTMLQLQLYHNECHSVVRKMTRTWHCFPKEHFFLHRCLASNLHFKLWCCCHCFSHIFLFCGRLYLYKSALNLAWPFRCTNENHFIFFPQPWLIARKSRHADTAYHLLFITFPCTHSGTPLGTISLKKKKNTGFSSWLVCFFSD